MDRVRQSPSPFTRPDGHAYRCSCTSGSGRAHVALGSTHHRWLVPDASVSAYFWWLEACTRYDERGIDVPQGEHTFRHSFPLTLCGCFGRMAVGGRGSL